jgi:hypothetical protein
MLIRDTNSAECGSFRTEWTRTIDFAQEIYRIQLPKDPRTDEVSNNFTPRN